MKIIFSAFVISLILIKCSFAITDKKIACMYLTLSNVRRGDGNFKVENIDPSLCTHLIYAYFGVTDEGEVVSKDPDLDLDINDGRGNIRKFNNLKHYNTNLKTFAAVGGWTEEPSYRYSKIARSDKKRQAFVKSAVEFLFTHNFDGFALHWCYPGLHGGDPALDKINFSKLIKEFKEELSKKNLLLMVIVHGVGPAIDESYEVAEIGRSADFIHVIAYDLYGDWSPHIGHGSGLYNHPKESDKSLCADSAMNVWLQGGAPPEKLLMGIPLFGRTFTLKYENQTEPGSLHGGAGRKSKYISYAGLISYMEFCDNLKTEKWKLVWEDTQKVPYAYLGDQWIGYENPRSIEIKAKYAIDKKFGGVAPAFVEDDDFRGFCGEKYTLLRTMNSILRTGTSEFEYVINVSVFKKSLKDKYTQCVYHSSEPLMLD